MTTKNPEQQTPFVTRHRRGASRLRLEADARFYGIGGNRPIVLLDLSQSGAKFRFDHPFHDDAGFLRWLKYETFGEVVWQNQFFVGVQFDEWLPPEWLLLTRQKSEHVNQVKRREAIKAAQEYVMGRL